MTMTIENKREEKSPNYGGATFEQKASKEDLSRGNRSGIAREVVYHCARSS